MDTEFEIIASDVEHGGELARFNNPAGVPYSAIYIHGREYASCEREKEKDIIKWFNESYGRSHEQETVKSIAVKDLLKLISEKCDIETVEQHELTEIIKNILIAQ